MANMAAPADTAPPQKPTLEPNGRPDVSAELASLKFEKQNKNLQRLPSNFEVQRRPLLHPPIASPYAGKDAPKVVYVSRKTPVMSAVKRVKRLLMHVEKRAMQDVDLSEKGGMKRLVAANEKLERDGEKVYVKASGRAMEQALRVADWFRKKEEEVRCHVEVTTGSVQAIDDLVEVSWDENDEDGSCGKLGQEGQEDVTMDTFVTSQASKTEDESTSLKEDSGPVLKEDDGGKTAEQLKERDGNRRRKRKRREYGKDEVPEARIRWIKTIEIAISLKA